MGRLYECPDCRNQVSKKANACPKCGRVLKKAPRQYGCGTLLLVGLIAFVGLAILVGKGERSGPRQESGGAALSDPAPRSGSAKFVSREDFTRLHRDAEGELPAYTVMYTANRLNGGRHGDVLVPTLSRKTPKEKLEAVAKGIAARENIDELNMYATEEASRGDRSASFAESHPGSEKGRLGRLEGGVYSPPL